MLSQTMIHFEIANISRKNGQSAVASASYRAAEELKDERYGKTHNYKNKKGVMSADIILPRDLKNSDSNFSRADIWNAAESAENRKDARVAKEFRINLPHKLGEDERRLIALEFAQLLVDKYNVIADVCIHKPIMKPPYDPSQPYNKKNLRENEKNGDERNYHAHIIITTRAAQLDKDKKLSFDKEKIQLEWSNKKRLSNGLVSSVKEIKSLRESFADIANKYLVANSLSKMDSRSYAAQNLNVIPTVKLGQVLTELERSGKRTLKGDLNRDIMKRNELVLTHYSKQKDLAFKNIDFIKENSPAFKGKEQKFNDTLDKIKNDLDESMINNHTEYNRILRLEKLGEVLRRSEEIAACKQEKVAEDKAAEAMAAKVEKQRAVEAVARAKRAAAATMAAKLEQQRQAEAAALVAASEEQQRQAAAEAAAMVKIEQQQAAEAKELVDIAKCTSFDLLNIRVETNVPGRSDLSGNLPIGATLFHAVAASKVLKNVSVREASDRNEHLNSSRTAQRIKKHILSNLTKTQTIIDYAELSIVDYTKKYGLDCDLSDLKEIYAVSDVKSVNDAQNVSELHSGDENTVVADEMSNVISNNTKNDDFDYGISF